MKIEQMFQKPIGRDLKGVIKVGQDDNANIRQELEEYVVTRELQRHFRDFFDSYKRGINGRTDKMGVWISGFFGSGKSHFLKILSYLLSNQMVDGKAAIDYFVDDEKITDKMVLANMKLAAATPADVALFNIDSKSEMNGKENKEAILSVFLKVFNEMQGFIGSIPALADVERNLSEIGRYEEFQAAFEESFGSPWSEARHDFDFIQDDVVDVLVDMDYMSESAARNICEKATRPYSITIEEFAAMVKKYLDRKGKNHHIVFLVDEIGQYIGDNSSLMLNLQTVVENLGTACQGKAWVIVTSQQDIDSITKTKGNDFSKIQGRFDTRLSLSSANVDEVIRKRILSKTDAARETLTLYYDLKETIIKNLILFNDGIEKKLYSSRENFAEVYPYIPYQFNLLGSVLTAIRTHGASGKHLAEGERSMLALFNESAGKLKDQETGVIIPFHLFYDALEQFLDHSHKGVISRALDNEYLNPDHAEECFDVNVLKTLFMIKYVKEIKANVENLTSLMVSSVDDDRMELMQRVEDALKRLIRQTLVQKNGEIYVFLTNEEQEINRAIESQHIEPSEITQKVSELIFDDLFEDKKYRYPSMNGRYAFAFNQVVDDKPYRSNQNHGITLRILTPNSDEATDEQTLRLISAQSSTALVVLPPDRAFLDEIRTAKQIEKFIQFDAVNTVTKYEEIKTAKKTEAHERNRMAKLYLEESLKAATIYVNGSPIQVGSKDVAARMKEAIGKLADLVYHKLSYIDTAMGENDIRKLFKQDNAIKLEGVTGTPNYLASRDILSYIAGNSSHHMKTSMKALLDRFTKAPYGFIEADVQWIVAYLFKNGDVSFYVNSEPVTLLNKSVDELVRYVTRREYVEKLLIEKREKATDKQKKAARTVMKDLFDALPASDEDDAIMSRFISCANDMLASLESLESGYYQHESSYPGRSLVSDGKRLMRDIAQITQSSEFFKTIAKKQDDYLDFAEDIEPVRAFFSGEQVAIWNRALKLMKIYDESRTFIVNAQIEQTVQQIKAIMRKEKPYNEVYKLPGLLDTYIDLYDQQLEAAAEPVRAAIENAYQRVENERKGKRCEAALKASQQNRFEQLREKAETCNNVATLHNIKLEADTLKIRCLNEIADAENNLIQAEAKENAKQEAKKKQPVDGKPAVTPAPAPKPKVKRKKNISIHSINTEATWQIETAEDVKKYISALENKLMAQLEEDTIIRIEF